LGVRFVAQSPLAGRFIADFVAPSIKLVIEVDGLRHHAQPRADARRDRVLRKLGYTVLRIPAALAYQDAAAAAALVRQAVVALLAA
jgi:very-short-patch-repair endonuclease